jgi:hypothetical protein
MNDFSGGLITEISERSLEDNQLAICTNLDPGSKGAVKVSNKFLDGASTYADNTQSTAVVAGYGLFTFANDNVMVSGTPSAYSGEFLVKSDGALLDILEVQTANNAWQEDALGTDSGGGDYDASDTTPCFYSAEGDLYVGGDHSTGNAVSDSGVIPASLKFHYQHKFIGLTNAREVKDWISTSQKRHFPVRHDNDTSCDMKVSERSTDNAGTNDGSNTIVGLGANELNWIIRYGADNTGNWTNTVAGAANADNFIEFAGSWLYKGGVSGAEAESDLT